MCKGLKLINKPNIIMKYTPIVFSLFSLHFSQSIEWEKIEQIPEGYQYVIDTNSNGDVIVGGF